MNPIQPLLYRGNPDSAQASSVLGCADHQVLAGRRHRGSLFQRRGDTRSHGGVNMATVSSKDLSERMSKRLANFKLSDAVIRGLADRVLIDGLSIARFDPCIYGICVDYFSDKLPRLDHLTTKQGI